jgi:trimethylamine monooxygenase
MVVKKVCIIGAGPSGMSMLYWLNQLDPLEVEIQPVCYEKQSNWGGLWNFDWRTGIDGETGEPVHGSMYRHLWSNGPKECLEYPDYTFMDHFGKATSSFPPRQAMMGYLQGRWTKGDLKKSINF